MTQLLFRTAFCLLPALLLAAECRAQAFHGGSDYSELAQNLAARAAHGGEKNISDLELLKLKKDISTIRWSVDPAYKAPAEVYPRASAYYTKGSRQVVLSSDVDHVSADVKETLSLHEALGALGYKDQHYQISTGIQVLAEVPDQNLRAAFGSALSLMNKKELKNGNLSDKASRGGATNVGGGGDTTALDVKLRTLKRIFVSNKVTNEFTYLLLKINFEPAPNSSKLGASYSPTENVMTFHVPTKFWKRMDPAAQEEMLQEISDTILSVYAVNKEVPTIIIAQCGKLIKTMPEEALTELGIQLREQITADLDASFYASPSCRIPTP